MRPRLLAALLLALGTTTSTDAVVRADDLPECDDWAAAGRCATAPDIMSDHCPDACAARQRLERKLAGHADRAPPPGGGGSGGAEGREETGGDDEDYDHHDDEDYHHDYDYHHKEL